MFRSLIKICWRISVCRISDVLGQLRLLRDIDKQDFLLSTNYLKKNQFLFLNCKSLFFPSTVLFQAYWPTQGTITTFQNSILLLCTFYKLVGADLNCPEDWDSMIENKNPSNQKKNGWRGFGGAFGPPKSITGLKPKNKPCCWVKNLRLCPGLFSQTASTCPRTVVEN